MEHGTEDPQGVPERIKISPELLAHRVPAERMVQKPVRVPGLALTRIGTQIEQWTETVLTKASAGDRFFWDVGLVTIPNIQPGGQLGISTAYAFTLFLASPVLNGKPLSLARIWPDNPSRETIELAVRSAVEELRSLRSAELQMRKRPPIT